MVVIDVQPLHDSLFQYGQPVIGAVLSRAENLFVNLREAVADAYPDGVAVGVEHIYAE